MKPAKVSTNEARLETMTTRPEELYFLHSPVTRLKGAGPAVAKALARILPTENNLPPIVRDLLFHLPSGFIDRRKTYPLSSAPAGETATFLITVESHQPPPPGRRGGKSPYRVLCSNETGDITLVFFHAHADYLNKALPIGEKRVISGQTELYDFALQMTHPDIIAPASAFEKVKGLEPVYPLTAGLTNRKVSTLIQQALKSLPTLPEWCSEETLKKFSLPGWFEAMHNVHAPVHESDLEPLAPARLRMAYDEIFANQLHLATIRSRMQEKETTPIHPKGILREQLLKELPFVLTPSQEEVLSSIDHDLASGHRMVRMVQGDVGSGKTIVALLAALSAAECDLQTAFMAPTELIARQHAKTLSNFCKNLPARISCLTGSVKGKERNIVLGGIESGEIQIIVGTHALFQESVNFHRMEFVVVDEQHRFGVNQRMALAAKGTSPHLLHMTATPIPRTLTMTAYGDMDCSLMKDKPAGRKPIITRVVPTTRMEEVMEAMQKALSRGEKIYWICPQIEDEKHTLTDEIAAATARHAEFNAAFSHKVGLVHGRMKADKRNLAMQQFAEGDTPLLVATTVVEVGVDVHDATIMIIEQAERFGLAQLHQLRGRVGRGDKPSSCLLMYTETASEEARARLGILRETEDGFRIAEEDLNIRGGGDLLGIRQSGLPQFRFTDLLLHREMILFGREQAKNIIRDKDTLDATRQKALQLLQNLYGYDYGY